MVKKTPLHDGSHEQHVENIPYTTCNVSAGGSLRDRSSAVVARWSRRGSLLPGSVHDLPASCGGALHDGSGNDLHPGTALLY